MDYHLDRGLRLKPGSGRSLYSWAINEIDEKGQDVGPDQIPWEWDLIFGVTSCVFTTGVSVKTRGHRDETLDPPQVAHPKAIRANLRPTGRSSDGDDPFYQPKYSMFGTERLIKSFNLVIYPLQDLSEAESCDAWGTVAYTAENDFRPDETDDHLEFQLHVKPETFSYFTTLVSEGAIDDMSLRVAFVDGFYSEWSPSISTRSVKVLARGKPQSLDLHESIDPPRLGKVGEAELYINRRLVFEAGAFKQLHDAIPATRIVQTATNQSMLQADPQIVRALQAIRRALWVVAGLLAVLTFALTL